MDRGEGKGKRTKDREDFPEKNNAKKGGFLAFFWRKSEKKGGSEGGIGDELCRILWMV